MKAYFLLPLLVSGGLLAQSDYHPRDTTYSIHSSYEKIRRSHPEVRPVYPRLPAGVLADTNLVYTSVENGRQLYLDVFRRLEERGPRPGVLLIHGGGWTTGSKENQIPMAQQLADRGYVTVTPEYRLSAEAPYPSGVKDLKQALRWMRAHATEYGIDSNRIAVYGASAGAHLASLLGVTAERSLYDTLGPWQGHSAQVQAVLNIDGIVSFVHPEAEPEWTGRSANAWLGDYAVHQDRWREASPLEYVDRHAPPFLFVNSSYPRFHAGRDDLFRMLDEQGIYHEDHTFPDSPHAFWLLDPWFEPTLELTVQFLKRVFP
ncbi:alpha/beta hydrolase [Neolewinella litorea]|uniref:Alpha/beta hydrolase n=1 Tax=Neolewinella litorea TaxID=2562452 RepID=A0A4S4NP65_9BACT|nr:alpha/beta hydrolase [Neolewinella litorea]THH41816.1 alpha/beta hydrolase [Neolewinella litorea]